MRGCEAVFHVAADYRLWVTDPAPMYRANVEGTRNLLSAAADAGVRRIVYTSSVATLGLNGNGVPADEDTPVALDDMIGHYKRSKFLAEEEVRRLIREQDLPAVIVTPHLGGGSRGSVSRMVERSAAKISRFLAGEPVQDVIPGLAQESS